MTKTHHSLISADGAAMTALRARLVANPIKITRQTFDQLVEQAPPAERIEYSESEVEGVPGVWCSPPSRRDGSAMLYLHGGVYLLGSARAFRNFVGRLSALSGVPAFIADYRLAPEHPFPAALDDARAALGGLVARFGTGRVALVGDSAGGGLALSLLAEEARTSCAVLLSPWTDLALGGESIEARAAEDPFLSRSALEAGIRGYLGSRDPRDPRASPLYGRRAPSAPPIQVHVGTAEVLLDDSLRLAAWNGVEVHVWEGMPHVFPRNVGLFEAARAAQELIASFLQRSLL
jgi:acetyl esterase/lipase